MEESALAPGAPGPDPHLGDVARFVGTLLVAEGRRDEAAGLVADFRVQHPGFDSAQIALRWPAMNPDFVAGRFDTDFIEKHLDELLEYVEEEDEILRLARFVADITAIGKNPYCR